MKNGLIIVLVVIFIAVMGGSAFAINTPVVVKNHGVATAFMVVGEGIMLGGEYGFTDELGISVNVGSYSKLAVKYEMRKDLAFLAGFGWDNSLLVGANVSKPINDKMIGAGEVDFLLGTGGGMSVMYNAGVRYRVDSKISIRGGIIGSFGLNYVEFPHLQIGVGYGF